VVTIVFDDFPEQTGWAIIDFDTKSEIIVVPPGTHVNGVDAMIIETVPVEQGGSYIFRIEDSNDGTTVLGRKGTYEVSLNGKVLVSGGGDFKLSESKDFSIPL
jgi:hypothetical protein